MKAKLISIGNPKGIRIPMAILKQCNIENEVDLEVEKEIFSERDRKLSEAHQRRAAKRKIA